MDQNTPMPTITEIKEYARQREKYVLKRNKLLHYTLELLIVGIVVYLLFGVILGIAIIEGDSMSPGIPAGSLILFSRLHKQPKNGDVVILNTSGQKTYLIKRVIARSGDVVNINNGTGKLIVNGKPEQSVCITGKTETGKSTLSYPYTVPVESIFVLGDNRENSLDSRELGVINLKRIVGTELMLLKFS